MTAAIEVNPYLGPVNDAVMDNIRLVHHVAKKYQNVGKSLGLDYNDICSIGTIGLIGAVRNYKPEGKYENIKFSSFAVPHIISQIRKELSRSARLVKISRPIVEITQAIQRHELQEMPTSDIAVRLKVSEKQVVRALQVMTFQVLSTDAKFSRSKGGDSTPIVDTLNSTQDLTEIYVKEFLFSLSEKERLAVRLRVEGKTQDQIGQCIGISQVLVSRLLVKIGAKFKQYLQGELVGA